MFQNDNYKSNLQAEYSRLFIKKIYICRISDRFLKKFIIDVIIRKNG